LETLKDELNNAIRLTSYLLNVRRIYNFITDSSYYSYICSLNKLEEYLSFAVYDNFDSLLSIIYDWDLNKQSTIDSSVKNQLISNLFIQKVIKK
jgi:hypothetical protein